MEDDYKIKPFVKIFLKTSSYVKIHYGEPNWIYILIEVDELLKNIMIFRIKLAIMFKENLIVNEFVI